MRNLFLLSFITAVALNVSSQAFTTDKFMAANPQKESASSSLVPDNKNFTLVLNGKQYHAGDTVSKIDFQQIEKSAIQIVGPGNKKYQPISYNWVVSIKDSNAIWKGSYNNPPNRNNAQAGKLAALLIKANYPDIVFIDEIKFAAAEAALPKQFSFFLR